jgi:stage IV sporulation protein A
MLFERAAEMGTKKVITEHSTIGIVVTRPTAALRNPREKYLSAEERVRRGVKANQQTGSSCCSTPRIHGR